MRFFDEEEEEEEQSTDQSALERLMVDSEEKAIESDPYTLEKDTRDYWQKVFEKFHEGDKLSSQEVIEMSSYAAARPDTIRRKLHEHGIFPVTEEEWKDSYPSPIGLDFSEEEKDPEPKDTGGSGEDSKQDISDLIERCNSQ
jgi:hypothetical protein